MQKEPAQIRSFHAAGSQVLSNRDSNRPPDSERARFYFDELGFYRHLDAVHRQYVCSNLALLNKQAAGEPEPEPTGDGGLENCFKAIRHDLGISHFDRTHNYKAWKKDWDEFMRSKLLNREPVTLNRDLKRRIRSGIPHDYRCKIWTALIRMRTKKIRRELGEQVYATIERDFVSKFSLGPERESHSNSPSFSSFTSSPAASPSTSFRPSQISLDASWTSANKRGSCDSTESSVSCTSDQILADKLNLTKLDLAAIDKCFRQIELDLLRTLPNNRHFEEPNSRGIQRVRRVLRAYACLNPAVGYCQGMNRLAAMALLVLPEEEAFWCLVAIVQCIMPRDYYLKPWLAQVDCFVLSELLERKMPKLHKHLINNDIQLTLFTWFFTIFVDGFRPELMLRIWDCFLLEGDKVLFRFALAILYKCQDELLKMHDFSTMSSHLSQLVSTRRLDIEQLFETFSGLNPLSSAEIENRREYHRNRMRPLLDE